MRIIEGKLTSPFGTRIHPVTKEKSFHNGIDIACPIGTPVCAPGNGRVEQIFSNEIGGLQMIISVSNERYGMAHLSECVLNEGDTFLLGEKIALSGNSGRTTGPHLHLTHKSGGKWVSGKYVGGNFIDPVELWEKGL
ncbi:MAG: M23 family metallopeptidase [Marinifilaceae bacterium]|nr:M23 family metallopeptidase [Marinifilaceae bacterium]